jgi:quinoprotein glucose dehydrogenase
MKAQFHGDCCRCLAAAVIAQRGARWQWRWHGGDGQHQVRAARSDHQDNVSRLRIAWRRPAVDPSLTAGAADLSYSHDFKATPLLVDGVLYGSNGIGLIEAFHPGTGKTIWVQQPYADEPDRGLRGASTRGLTYWTDGTTKRLFVIRGEYLMAIDGHRRPSAGWGENGRVNLKTGLGPRATQYSSTSGARVCGDVVMVGNNMGDAPQVKEQPPGNVQAFDVRTGKPRWSFRVIPRPGELGNETWENDSWAFGPRNLWSLITADEERPGLFPPTSATSDMYGGIGSATICSPTRSCASGARPVSGSGTTR